MSKVYMGPVFVSAILAEYADKYASESGVKLPNDPQTRFNQAIQSLLGKDCTINTPEILIKHNCMSMKSIVYFQKKNLNAN